MESGKMKGVSEAEARLNELIAAFSLERAERWLRAQFASFDAADARAFDDALVTRTEQGAFAAVRRLGAVMRLPAARGTAQNHPVPVYAIQARDDTSVSRSGRLVQFNFAKKLLKREIETFRGDGLPTQGHCSCMMNLV